MASGLVELTHTASDASAPALPELLVELISRLGIDGWQVRRGPFWCYADPGGRKPPAQGWKLHVSATPGSAADILTKAAEVLLRHGCPFKFVPTLQQVVDVNAARADRSRSGKFLTAYPDDDGKFRAVADDLHQATAGLPGPAILSDRQYREGSPVYFRYGAFAERLVLNDRGSYEQMLIAPDGTLVVDARNPWFSPPAWATPPIDLPPAPARTRGGPVVVAERYVVRQAIRHANRGGVYRAADSRTGGEVVLKEARPFTCPDLSGHDACDLLRHEAAMLQLLQPLGFTPRYVDLFDYQGHLFLVQEFVTGAGLRGRFDEHRQRGETGPTMLVAATPLIRRLIAIVDAVHRQGVVVQDLSPSNILLTEGDTPVLIDLESVEFVGIAGRRSFTVGYAAPEHMRRSGLSTGPRPEADLYSLGATILNLLTGVEPLLPDDSPPTRPLAERFMQLATTAAADHLTLRTLLPLIEGLTAQEPQHRWPLVEAVAFLDTVSVRTRPPVPRGPGRRARMRSDVNRLIEDGLDFIIASAQPAARYLWELPDDEPGDPCAVQSGAAGVLAMLTQAAVVSDGDHRLDAVNRVAQWIATRLDDEPRILPGLYFGRSGTAWALFDAARCLGNEELESHAVSFAQRIPTRWHDADICHGLAGAGLAQLHLWHGTGRPEFAARAKECAEAILTLLHGQPQQLHWPIAGSYPDDLAGMSRYGFAHGIAGVGAFLLAAGEAVAEPYYLEVARAGGLALCAVAERINGGAWWPSGPGPNDEPGLNYWCHGSAGVATFLVRLWASTGEPAFLQTAREAAVAIRRDRWRLGPVACHGLAGNGELLLDLAEATAEARYRDWAWELAAAIHCRTALRGGRLVVPNETFCELTVGYNTGLAGVLSFLMRLLHGGARPFMVDRAAGDAQLSSLVRQLSQPSAKGGVRI